MKARWLLPALLLLAGCSTWLPDPVRRDSLAGVLDLRSWSFSTQGPVVPEGWMWDAGVLWSPPQGRPQGLPPPRPLGGLDKGGSLGVALGTSHARLAVATAQLSILIDGTRDYALQVGAFPGAYRVWVNGVLVRESGVVSADPEIFRERGAGGLITVQPLGGVVEIVVELATADPLVRHSEMNRLWMIGPDQPLMGAEKTETGLRSLQAVMLSLGLVVFFWISRLRTERKALLVFVAFLAVCLLKLLANVEQPEPTPSSVLPGVPLAVYLFLNHGLNLWPFPLFFLFLYRQFPQDIGRGSLIVLTVATAVVTLWELLPFTLLAAGWSAGYDAVMRLPWALVLNLYVVAVTLYIVERFYHLYTRRRPLAAALFFGGIALGLIILIPVPLSVFTPVKHTYFLGWGLFIYLLVLCFALIRLQIQSTEERILSLTDDLEKSRSVARMVSPYWAAWVGREALSDVKPGDRRISEASVVQLRFSEEPERWLPLVGEAAQQRKAVLVDWRDGTATWVLDAWSETALVFALEAQRRLTAASLTGYSLLAARASVEFRILDLGTTWFPSASLLPFARLEELAARASAYGAVFVLDAGLQDGLVIGGWRRHRHLTAAGTEIELYEAEEDSLASLKDKTLDLFQQGLAKAKVGRFDEAVQAMFAVVKENPFDQAAKALLTEWGERS